MKMPEKIEFVMFAPCGMNCLECGGNIAIHDAECSECQYRLRD